MEGQDARCVCVCICVCVRALSNRESQITQIPELRAGNRQKFRGEKQQIEWTRSKVESRKIDSEPPSESRPIDTFKVILKLHYSARIPIQNRRFSATKKCVCVCVEAENTFGVYYWR